MEKIPINEQAERRVWLVANLGHRGYEDPDVKEMLEVWYAHQESVRKLEPRSEIGDMLEQAKLFEDAGLKEHAKQILEDACLNAWTGFQDEALCEKIDGLIEDLTTDTFVEKPVVPHPIWEKSVFEHEEGEVERAAKYLFRYRNVSETVNLLKNSIEQGKLVGLEDDMWQKIENTDSNEIKIGDMGKAMELAEMNDRRAESVMSDYVHGSRVEAPIVLCVDNEDYYLISGNTRLMVARGMGIRPKVWLCNIESK